MKAGHKFRNSKEGIRGWIILIKVVDLWKWSCEKCVECFFSPLRTKCWTVCYVWNAFKKRIIKKETMVPTLVQQFFLKSRNRKELLKKRHRAQWDAHSVSRYSHKRTNSFHFDCCFLFTTRTLFFLNWIIRVKTEPM